MAPRYKRSAVMTLALSMMLKLCHSYDAGGHSARSIKSRLLESMLFLYKIPKKRVRITPDFLKGFTETISARRALRGPMQLLLFPELTYLSNDEYSSVVMWYVREEYRLYWAESSWEEDLIGTIVLLLESDEYILQFQKDSISPEMLLREGRLRWVRQQPTQDY